MIKDRLGDLKSKREFDSDVEEDVKPTELEKEILSVLEKFDKLNEWIQNIRNNIEEMQETVSAPSFHYNDKATRSMVESIMGRSVALCGTIYASIKQLQEDLDREESRGSILFRVKHTQFIMAKDAYLSAYEEHEQFVNFYENKLVKIMKQEASIMNSNIKDDEETQMLEGNQMSLFVGNFLDETEKAKLVLRDIIARHTQLVELMKSLTLIRDMFVDVSNLVLEQGSLVQMAKYHTEQAVKHTEKTVQHLEKARGSKMKALKKKLYFYILAIATLVLVLLIIIL